jgi:hypothetical protein
MSVPPIITDLELGYSKVKRCSTKLKKNEAMRNNFINFRYHNPF